MAQDFHTLTGQVVGKVVELAGGLERVSQNAVKRGTMPLHRGACAAGMRHSSLQGCIYGVPPV
ncbi:MAG: hypothetical protein KDI23_09615, partial [Pseudomonadales bacterium]|nr:hypothetical protein [Pseudomonadales bacterium]